MAAHTHSHMQAHIHVHKHTYPHVYTQNNAQCAKHYYNCFSRTNSISSQSKSIKQVPLLSYFTEEEIEAQKGFAKSVRLLSHVRFFATLWIAACQASLSITNSLSLLKLISIELVMTSNHLILCRPILFPPSIFPSIRVFSNELALHIRWPKYCGISFNISPSNEYSGFIAFMID